MTSVNSSRVLKANDLRGQGAKIAFNYVDLQKRCDDYLEKVRSDARKLLEEAHASADELRRKAATEGIEAGRREGMQEAERHIEERAKAMAEQRLAERLSLMAPALESLTGGLALEKDRWLGEWESTAVRLCVGIAGRLLRRKFDVQPELVREMMAHALELAIGSAQVTVRMNPGDLELMGDQATELVRTLSSCAEATLVPDAGIERGGCFIETQHGRIDARLETQLDRITQELLPQME